MMFSEEVIAGPSNFKGVVKIGQAIGLILGYILVVNLRIS